MLGFPCRIRCIHESLQVVGSHISGISDVITRGQNGLLVRPESTEALANAALTLLNNEGLRRKIIDEMEGVYRVAIHEGEDISCILVS